MLIFMVICVLGSLAAMLLNDFKVTALSKEWGQGWTLPSGDTTVASLAASWFCLHGKSLLNNLLASFDFRSKDYFSLPWDFLGTLSSWLTASLAIFYFGMISFSLSIFLWLRWRISPSVPRLLLGSLIVSGLTFIPAAIENAILLQMMSAQGSHDSDTLVDGLQTISLYFILSHLALLWLIPLFLFLVSTLLLMYSLDQHLGQTRDCRPSPHEPSTQEHTMPLKSLAFFLIFYTSYFLSLITVVMNGLRLWNHWHWAREVVTCAGNCLHSRILGQSLPKLREALKKRLW
uniref:Taste receptor type 2 n=1 Tax=Catagonus wagneri TaxID=51154 RepID=A0A8C3W193_9CETA